jgi:flagellar hook assembly protein FlgD
VSLRIYDLAGRPTHTLAAGRLAAGEHRLTWDLTDERGTPVAAGLYFVRLNAVNHAEVRRVVVTERRTP